MAGRNGLRTAGRGLLGTAVVGSALALLGCAQGGPAAPISPTASGTFFAEPRSAIDCRSEPSSHSLTPDGATPDPSLPTPGRVPAGFQAIAAIRCSLDFGDADADTGALDMAWRVERFEGDLEPLLAALDAPDDSAPVDLVCTADLELVPPLWLESSAGDFVAVHYPRDACGKTKPAVHDALDALQLADVDRVPWTGS